MIQTKFQKLLTCILYTYDKINIHTSWRLFNLFRRLRSWRCEGGAIGVIWRWTTYRSLRGRANAISFFIYFDYFIFIWLVFFIYCMLILVLHVFINITVFLVHFKEMGYRCFVILYWLEGVFICGRGLLKYYFDFF